MLKSCQAMRGQAHLGVIEGVKIKFVLVLNGDGLDVEGPYSCITSCNGVVQASCRMAVAVGRRQVSCVRVNLCMYLPLCQNPPSLPTHRSVHDKGQQAYLDSVPHTICIHSVMPEHLGTLVARSGPSRTIEAVSCSHPRQQLALAVYLLCMPVANLHL